MAAFIVAAVVYALVVTPYTRAKERFFPSEPAGPPADVALLQEIRDLLEVHPVETIDQALAIALRGASLTDGKLRFPELPLPPVGDSRGVEGEARLHLPR